MELPAKEKGVHHEILGAALVDMGEDGVTQDGWYRLREQLVTDGLRNERISAQRRVSIGEYLADAGDPRQEVMELDAMLFCYVPPGPFFLGSTETGEMAYDDEKKGAGEHNLDYAYWLARIPVTVAQFRQYVDESGIQPADTNCLTGPANTPVAWVSWDEAMVFCSWLTQRWRAKGWLSEGCHITLPSEPEWEKGARGGVLIPAVDGEVVAPLPVVAQRYAGLATEKLLLAENPMAKRRYPWGDKPDEERLNFKTQLR